MGVRARRADLARPARRRMGGAVRVNITDSRAALEASRRRVLAAVGEAETILTQATGARMVAAWTLAPALRDPVRHLEAAHARARAHLGRLTTHDPTREIPSVMTNELYSRLTDSRPAPLTPSAGVHRYTYTPRKALRRVLDHTLDHLNQIDQWLAWRNDGVVPTPTDGWVPSTVTLPDDRLPLSHASRSAWLSGSRSSGRVTVAGTHPSVGVGTTPAFRHASHWSIWLRWSRV